MAIANTIQQTTQTNFGYDRDTDYQKLIDEAVKAQDWTRAAIYEAMRNEKIAGENAPYQPTYNYQQYLPGGMATAQPEAQSAPGGAQTGVENIDLFSSVMPNTPTSAQSNPPVTVEQTDLKASAMPAFENPYMQQLDEAIAGLDPEAYKRFYLQEANRSAQDVLGKYAAMTGGIPSTAAVSAASQAADYQKSQLAGQLVDLNAQRANLLMNAGQMAQNNYQQQISAAMQRWTQLGYADQQVQDILGVPVGTPTSDQAYTNWSQSQAEQQVQREQSQAAKEEAYNLAMTLISAGMMPDDATLILAGIPKSAAQQLYSTTAKPTTGTPGNPNPDPNGIVFGSGMSADEFRWLQMTIAGANQLGDQNAMNNAFSTANGKISREQYEALCKQFGWEP